MGRGAALGTPQGPAQGSERPLSSAGSGPAGMNPRSPQSGKSWLLQYLSPWGSGYR